ncbi:hypothetical protein A500_19972 [Clostridium sartagoforme AAU1]|uniref:Uncharacterized protein n=1 Tax=Clostridium sartagoforme AAU1 TaxID=1202534 RepID=R9BRR6_9CLOT|nr:hypothetical protein A500_19972 [Clostridium sartagoforme AAU1]
MIIGITAKIKAAIASSHCLEKAPKKLFMARGIVFIFPFIVSNGNKKSFHINIPFRSCNWF